MGKARYAKKTMPLSPPTKTTIGMKPKKLGIAVNLLENQLMKSGYHKRNKTPAVIAANRTQNEWQVLSNKPNIAFLLVFILTSLPPLILISSTSAFSV